MATPTQKPILPMSVLIPTMNRLESTKRTLQSFMDGECLPAEIIVVDQTPDKSERRELETFMRQMDGIRGVYVYQEEPSSTVSRNTATDLATHDVLVYSDDDIIVYPDTVYQLHRQFEDPKLSLLAVWDSEYRENDSLKGKLFEIFSNGISYHKRDTNHITKSLLGRLPSVIETEAPSEWAMGYFFAVRKALLTKWNIRWDEELSGYAYAEDLDLTYLYCKRSREEGYRCAITKAPSVRHMVEQKNRVSPKKNVCIYVLNRLYLSYKHRLGCGCRLAVHWRNWTLGLWMACKRLWKLSDLTHAYSLYRKHKKAIQNGHMSAVYRDIE